MPYVVLAFTAVVMLLVIVFAPSSQQKCVAQELRSNVIPMWTGDVMIMVPSEDWTCTRYAGESQ